MTKLSIGMFTYSTRPRGSVVHAACLADELQAQGHDVTLYALDKDGEGFFRPLRADLQLMQAAPAEPGTEQLVRQRIQEVRRFALQQPLRHDVLHAQDCLVASGLLEARGERNLPPLCRTLHHVEHFDSVYLERCQARSVRECDLCLTVSRASQAALRATYGRGSTVVPSGVDLDRYGPLAKEARRALRRNHGVDDAAPLIVSVGGVEPRKNSLRMLQAFALLHAQRPEAQWWIVGGASLFDHGAYRHRFAAELDALPAATKAAVKSLGVVDDDALPGIVGAADVLMHASAQEGFGLVVLEALACGIEVVVSHGSPFDEFVDDLCAHRVDPTDPASIAGGLRRALATRPEDRPQQLRARAADHSWSRSAQRHVQLYEQLRTASSQSERIP